MKQSAYALLSLVGLIALSPSYILASSNSENPESYRLELSASAWLMNTNGLIRADGTPINLISDLGIYQRQKMYDGRIVLKAKKHRFVIEAMPISIRGLNTINRSVSYFGENYSFSETLKSSAHMNYIYGGFHKDWFSGKMGRIGSSLGAAYLGLSGSIDGEQSGLEKSKKIPFGVPLAGIDFRLYLIPGKRWLAMEGAVRGLPAGSYGHWIEASGGVGGWIGPVGAQIGYRELLIDGHETHASANGVNLRMVGPMATVFWNW